MLEIFKKVNPDNDAYMKALKNEISGLTIGYDQVRLEAWLNVNTSHNGFLKVSLPMLENRTVSELWVVANKVR